MRPLALMRAVDADDERTAADVKKSSVVLVDGLCVLCSRWYRFVTSRDTYKRFRFVAIQSAEGTTLARQLNIDPQNPETFACVELGSALFKSDAVLKILAELPGWRWTMIIRKIPTPVRDAVYDIVARNRYRWFGRLQACSLPAADDASGSP